MRNNFPPGEFCFTLLVLFFSIFFSITAGEGCLTLMMLCGGINTITRSAYLAFIKIKLKLPQTRSGVVFNYRFCMLAVMALKFVNKVSESFEMALVNILSTGFTLLSGFSDYRLMKTVRLDVARRNFDGV